MDHESATISSLQSHPLRWEHRRRIRARGGPRPRGDGLQGTGRPGWVHRVRFCVVPPPNTSATTNISYCHGASRVQSTCYIVGVSRVASGEPLPIPATPNNFPIPSPTTTPPPTDPIINLNPSCPPQDQVPVSRDSCAFSGTGT